MDAKGADGPGKKSLLDRPVSLFTTLSVIAVVALASFGVGIFVATSNMTGDAAWLAEFREWRIWKARTPTFLQNMTMNMSYYDGTPPSLDLRGKPTTQIVNLTGTGCVP